MQRIEKKILKIKKNYIDVGLDGIFGNQMILRIENKMKTLVVSTEN